MNLLEKIDSPEDLKALNLEQLEELTGELREEIIETVNRTGGHLAAPLGVVEITTALHYVFDAERDPIVWDVGHQCYAHKLLTGRREQFHALRQKDGISGYPKITESKYDSFGTGHSSTSISAAVGMAVANQQLGRDNHVVALIGDGAMTGGMALEGLMHAGQLGLNLLVILNDNEMSIAPNISVLSKMFNRMITAGPYKRATESVESFSEKLLGHKMTRTILDIEKTVKGFITKGGFFQEFGFNYIGPMDGHDLPLLIECLSNIKKMHGPILLHCRTEKGKGLKMAEEDPSKFHGIKPSMVRPIDTEGDPLPAKTETDKPVQKVNTFTGAFSEAIIAAAHEDERIIAITAAMPDGTGLNKFQELFPDRFFDVGIAEQHAMTFAAGLATQGMRPVAAIYSTFLQRGYDQVIHDVCLQNLPVVMALDRAGIVGEDSPTHDGMFDLSFLRVIPNLSVLAPRDDVDTKLMLRWALQHDGPVAIRYARGNAPTLGAAENRDVTRGEVLREGNDGYFLAVGPGLQACMDAAELLEQNHGRSIGVADARLVKPLDTALLDTLGDKPMITVEENVLMGGFGTAVLEYFNTTGQDAQICCVGLPDKFGAQATRGEQLLSYGLTAECLVEKALSVF